MTDLHFPLRQHGRFDAVPITQRNLADALRSREFVAETVDGVETVRELAMQAKLPTTPEVGIYESPDMNAFATGPTKSRSLVAVSTGLLDRMSEQQARAVVGHNVPPGFAPTSGKRGHRWCQEAGCVARRRTSASATAPPATANANNAANCGSDDATGAPRGEPAVCLRARQRP